MKKIIFIFSALLSMNVSAQKGLYVGVNFVEGFQSQDVEINYVPISAYQNSGFSVFTYYNLNLTSKWELRPLIGFKQLYYSGKRATTSFNGTTSKLLLGLSSYYRWNEEWKTGLGFSLENNRDFDDFRANTSDLFRYAFNVNIGYSLTENFFLTLQYSTTLSPIADIYLLTNPQHQVGLGLDYKLPWL